MKRSFIYLTLAALLVGLLAVLPAAAQNRRGDRGPRANPEHRVERELRMLDRHLDLSDAQMEQLRQLWTAHHEAGRAWHEANPEATPEQQRAFMEEHRAELRSALEGILTPEQLEAFDAHGGRGLRGRRGPHDGFGFGGLDLSEEQRARVREILETHRAEGRTWHEANPEATPEERRAFMEAHRAGLRAALEGILTPEQLEAFDERGGRGPWGRRGPRGGQPGDGAGAVQGVTVDAEQDEATPRRAFGLTNYPNPFNPTTEIRFELPEAATVSLAVFDLQGREVARLLEGALGAGAHTATFEAGALPTGTYLYRLTVGGVSETGTMLLTK